MKLPELKSKFKNRYAIRIIAGVLVVTLVATGSSVYSVNAAKAGNAATETVEETEVSEEAEDTEDRLHQLWMDTRSYREAVKIAPRRVSEFLSGVLREHRREQSVTRQSRTQQRNRDWEIQL